MISINNFFYKSFMTLAYAQGFTIKQLAELCGVKAQTLSKMLKQEDGSDLESALAAKLRDIVAPNLTIDELYIEARFKADTEVSLVRAQ